MRDTRIAVALSPSAIHATNVRKVISDAFEPRPFKLCLAFSDSIIERELFTRFHASSINFRRIATKSWKINKWIDRFIYHSKDLFFLSSNNSFYEKDLKRG